MGKMEEGKELSESMEREEIKDIRRGKKLYMGL